MLHSILVSRDAHVLSNVLFQQHVTYIAFTAGTVCRNSPTLQHPLLIQAIHLIGREYVLVQDLMRTVCLWLPFLQLAQLRRTWGKLRTEFEACPSLTLHQQGNQRYHLCKKEKKSLIYTSFLYLPSKVQYILYL